MSIELISAQNTSFHFPRDILTTNTRLPIFDDEEYDNGLQLPQSSEYMELLHIALRNDWDTFTGLSLTDKFEILLIESDHFHLNKRMITFRCCYEELDIINEIPDEKRFVKLRLELNDIRKIMKLRHDERGTAWIIANGKFGLTILNILTDEFGYDATIENPETEFVTAVRSGENFLVSQLIKNYGIDINKPSFTCDFPALRYSVNINRPEMVKLLLSLGADIEGSENPHGSPLYEACLWGRIECAKILIDAGANLNYQARWRDTDQVYSPISAAMGYQKVDILRLLIESGVDIHQKFPGDNTVLHLHLANDRTSPNTEKIIEMTTMLIAAGADINARNADGKTPLCMAREGKYKPTEYVERMTSFMIENGAVE